MIDRGLGLPQPPRCFAQPTECLRRLLAIDRGAKRVARRDPVPAFTASFPTASRSSPGWCTARWYDEGSSHRLPHGMGHRMDRWTRILTG